MFAAKQMYASQGTTYGNANITGSGTTSSPATVFANTVSTSTYLTYIAPTQAVTTGTGYADYPTYAQVFGNLTVTGNTALLDILIVGAGGYTTIGSRHGGDGGQVLFYSNVIVPVGTYNLSVAGCGAGGYPTPAGTPLGYSNITIGSTNITSLCGTGYYTTTGSATGGSGSGGAQASGVGGSGTNIPSFGTDVTWIFPAMSGNLYYGGGGGGASGTADNAYYAGGKTSGYTYGGTLSVGNGGIYAQGYSPTAPVYQQGIQSLGGGAGGGNSAGLYESYYSTYYGGTGTIIIRHRAS